MQHFLIAISGRLEAIHNSAECHRELQRDLYGETGRGSHVLLQVRFHCSPQSPEFFDLWVILLLLHLREVGCRWELRRSLSGLAFRFNVIRLPLATMDMEIYS